MHRTQYCAVNDWRGSRNELYLDLLLRSKVSCNQKFFLTKMTEIAQSHRHRLQGEMRLYLYLFSYSLVYLFLGFLSARVNKDVHIACGFSRHLLRPAARAST